MNWENYPIVYLTPDAELWNPHCFNFESEEDAMVDSDGLIVQQVPRPRFMIFTEADVSELYAE
jgi:hypothetical protein